MSKRAQPDCVAGNDPEALELAFQHQCSTFLMHIFKLLQTSPLG